MGPVPWRLVIGLLMLASGQILILDHILPASYYYFPLVWYGYILVVDAGLEVSGRKSLWGSARTPMVYLIPISAGFWWVFELFDQAVHNWRYVGGGGFTGLAFVALASLCFSTVLPAIWETALVVEAIWNHFLGRTDSRPPSGLMQTLVGHDRIQEPVSGPVETRVLSTSFVLGVACVVLPIVFPRYAFSLIWGSLFLILDPINAWLAGPSLLLDAAARRFDRIAVFAMAGLICGFLWEFWNYWAVVRWVYDVPYVSQLHLFAMPLPGYLGYLPFGLEAFAATGFGLTLVRLAASSRRPLPTATSAVAMGREPVRPEQ